MSIRRLIPLALVAGLLWVPAGASGAPAPGELVEKRVPSQAPGSTRVRESLVRVYDPLPAEVGPHPEACDWLEYLRFRHRNGPREPERADAVVVIIPGFLGGAASFDQLARHTVRRAAARGQKIEYWALDRRANCLEDDTGTRAAARAGDATIAWDYYWGGAAVDGKTFAGFLSPQEAEFLGEFGLARTMQDWYTVLRTGIRGQSRRARKVICGGHSLGGPLTAAFAGWDFDGDPETKRDAGYRQCAGLVGLDTTLALSGPGGGGVGLGIAGGSGASPYVNLPPLTPETFQVPAVFGVGAFFDPQETDLLRELPHTQNIDLSQRLLFSRDAAHFATNDPNIRDFTLTNEVTLAGVLDDNSAPLSFLRSSLGQVAGGPLVDKNFPTPGEGFLALPEDPATPLYSWDRYRAVGKDGAPIALNDAGEPYTSREGEVSDLRQFARTMFEAPANFIEQYFPTRILTDVAAAGAGDRSGSLAALQHDGVAERPALLIQAADSDDNSAPDEGPPFRGPEPPNELELSREVIIPGYNHLDVATPAWRQNDGEPEPSSLALARFTKQAVAAAAPGR
ncbi:MAG: hypothetical protein ACRDLO_10635 [Solirubrobacterales bacterium]